MLCWVRLINRLQFFLEIILHNLHQETVIRAAANYHSHYINLTIIFSINHFFYKMSENSKKNVHHKLPKDKISHLSLFKIKAVKLKKQMTETFKIIKIVGYWLIFCCSTNQVELFPLLRCNNSRYELKWLWHIHHNIINTYWQN